MRDELTFYQTDTKTLEQKIMTRDLIVGNEIAGHLERLGKHMGSIYMSKVAIGDIFMGLEEVFGYPYHVLLGRGERRLEPGGPTTYCGRQIPSELGEFVMGIQKIQKIKSASSRSDDEQAKLDTWLEIEQRIGLDKEGPQALTELRKFLNKYRSQTPELISVYTRW